MRFEVPQFIEVEDKIFGPLTWRQFLYLGGGVGFAAVLFFTVPFIIFMIIGIPLALLSGALAFYPVNNRPFSYFLEAIFNYITTTRLYLWRQKADVVHKNSSEAQHQNTAAYVTPQTAELRQKGQRTNITSLARKLELEALQKSDI